MINENLHKEKAPIHGAYGVIITPFLENGKVDYKELKQQLAYVCDSPIEGIIVCGSTGEFTYLSVDEMKELMRFTQQENAGRKKLICGATASNCLESLELLAFAESIGADGALVAPPYYFHLGDNDVLDFYTTIATAPGNMPIIAYQIPQCTSSISMAVFRELLKLPRIQGIKNSSGNCNQILQQIALRNEMRPDFSVLTGSDESIYALVNCGADGSFTATAYIYPYLIAKVYEHLHDAEGINWQMDVIRLNALAASIPYPLGYKMFGEASGRMKFGTYLQAVSEKRMQEYEKIKQQMKALLSEMEERL